MTKKLEKKIIKKPIKQPKQRRSRQTVDNILEACELLIKEYGLEKLTTNQIAERAGVNIASLYQYFPNKESIVNTLINRLFERESQAISDSINSLINHKSIKEASKQVIYLAIRIFRSSESLLLHIIEYEGQEGYMQQAQGFTYSFTEAGHTFLSLRRKELRVKNLDHALYILSNSIIPLIMNYLSKTPSKMNDEEFVEEVSDLVCCYLLK